MMVVLRYFNSSSEADFFALRFTFENLTPKTMVVMTRIIPRAKRTQAPADACPLFNFIPRKSTFEGGGIGSAETSVVTKKEKKIVYVNAAKSLYSQHLHSIKFVKMPVNSFIAIIFTAFKAL